MNDAASKSATLSALASALRALSGTTTVTVLPASADMPERVAIYNATGKLAAQVWHSITLRGATLPALMVCGPKERALAPFVARCTTLPVRTAY